MIALDSLKGDYGHVVAGERFHVTEDLATHLESQGLAYRYRKPQFPNKMMIPSRYQTK